MPERFGGLNLFDYNAEAAVLSAMIQDSDAVGTATAIVKEEDFFKNSHKIIFRSIVELYESSKAVDLVTIMDKLEERNLLEKAGGANYIIEISDVVLSSANLESHAEIVKDHANYRWLAGMSIRLQDDVASRKDKAPDLILSFMDEGFKKGIIGGAGKDVRHISESIPQAIKVIEERVMNKGKKLPGITTGFTDIDNIMNGLLPGTLTLIAARTSMGKSAFLKDIIMNASFSTDDPIYWGDYEMTTIESIMRLTSSSTRIPSTSITLGELEEMDINKITAFYDALKTRNIFTNDNPRWDIKKVSAYLRKLKLKYGKIALAAFDYIQIMPRDSRQDDNKALAEMSMQLKNLSKEIDAPIIALSQLNRKLEERKDKRPELSDLRASGGLEENSDNVIFIYRDEVYDKNTDFPNMAEILIKKHRNGRLGMTKLFYNKATVGFYNMQV